MRVVAPRRANVPLQMPFFFLREIFHFKFEFWKSIFVLIEAAIVNYCISRKPLVKLKRTKQTKFCFSDFYIIIYFKNYSNNGAQLTMNL